MADRLRMAPGQRHVEYQFGLTKSLQPTEFFGSDVWVRGKLDFALVKPDSAVVIDYKTGKRKIEIDQLKLFALAALKTWPWIKTVTTGYAWLPINKIDKEVYSQDDASQIHADFAQRVHRMELSEQENNWPARPSGLCREWCPVGRRLCEHCGQD